MSSGDESDNEFMSAYMLKDISCCNQFHLIINRIEANYKICDSIKRVQAEWKGLSLFTLNLGKVLHKVFKSAINEILQALPIWGESVS